jgi:hypothetical protein
LPDGPIIPASADLLISEPPAATAVIAATAKISLRIFVSIKGFHKGLTPFTATAENGSELIKFQFNPHKIELGYSPNQIRRLGLKDGQYSGPYKNKLEIWDIF